MKRRARYTAQARSDLASLAAYFRRADARADASRKVLDDIRSAEHPSSGRAQDEGGIRKSVSRVYGYVIYYRVDEAVGAVDILTIQHARRDHQPT